MHHSIFAILISLAIVIVCAKNRQKLRDNSYALKRRLSSLDVTTAEIEGYMPAVLGSLVSTTSVPDIAVTFAGCDEPYRALIRPLVQAILAPVVGAVEIKHCGGVVHEPIADGRFRIFIRSSAIESAGVQLPGDYIISRRRSIFGRRSTLVDRALAPSGLGCPIANENGFFVGELVGKNLYLHFEPIGLGTAREATRLGKFLLDVRDLILSENASALAGGKSQAERFQEACLQPVGRTSGSSSYLQSRFSATLRQTRAQQIDLLAIEGTKADISAREFEQICNIGKVLNVKVKRRKIIVKTDTLFCLDPRDGQLHEIGKFSIHIPMNGLNVRWYNKTRWVKGYTTFMSAPHVPWSGKACMGTSRELFRDLIETREFACAVELAIAFIESVNTDDRWGESIDCFPVAHRAQSSGRQKSGAYLVDWTCQNELTDGGVPFESEGLYCVIKQGDLTKALSVMDATAIERGSGDSGTKLKLRFHYEKSGVVASNRSRARYINVCSKRIQGGVDDVRNRMQHSLPVVRREQADFFSDVRNGHLGQTKGEEGARLLQEELERLSAVDKITGVRFANGTIFIDTDTLCAQSRRSGRRHELGQFCIAIRNDGVRWFNKTRRIDAPVLAMNAPNVFADGTPVFDEVIVTLVDLSARCEFAVVADLAIQFVETISEDLEKYLDKRPPAQEVTHAKAG